MATPVSARVKGMFIESTLSGYDRANRPRPTRHRFRALSDYPLREFMDIALCAASELHPSTDPSEGLHQLGRLAYPTFAETVLGRVIFAVATRTWPNTLRLSPRAYSVCMRPGQVSLSNMTAHGATVHLREIWSFVESYQVGVFGGGMEYFGVKGEVEVHLGQRACDADLEISFASIERHEKSDRPTLSPESAAVRLSEPPPSNGPRPTSL